MTLAGPVFSSPLVPQRLDDWADRKFQQRAKPVELLDLDNVLLKLFSKTIQLYRYLPGKETAATPLFDQLAASECAKLSQLAET